MLTFFQTRMARWFLLASLTVVISGCGGDGGGQGGRAAPSGLPVAAMEIAPRDLSRHLSVSGTVEPRVRIRLASRTSGTLKAVYVEEGDNVAAGQVLAELDVSEEEAELGRARARELQARQDYNRAAEMYARELVSTSEYERQSTNLRVAESERELWETRVDFGRVLAPQDAVVTAKFIEPGEAVASLQTLFELVAMNELVVRLGVSELDVVHLETGQQVPVMLDALPGRTLEGSIRRIWPQADGASRLVTVEVSLPAEASATGVRPGYLARIRMPIDERPDVIAVPAAAVGEAGDSAYVYVIAEDRLQRRLIERGVTRGQWTEVLSGLEPGEIILATNPIDMSEGQRVRIVGWRG